jgi:hypothetical protein
MMDVGGGVENGEGVERRILQVLKQTIDLLEN